MYLNKVMLLGNLTRDPEMKALPSGQKVCSFSLATNEVYKDKDGSKKERVEFHNVVAWGKTAENVAQYMKKGSQIYIEGKNQTRSWDGPDGKKLYRTEVLANSIQFGNKPGGQAPSQKVEASEDHGEHPNEEEIPLDDIPF